MGASKNRGTPKWMVYNGKTLLKWMIWGETPLFSETPIWIGLLRGLYIDDFRLKVSEFASGRLHIFSRKWVK